MGHQHIKVTSRGGEVTSLLPKRKVSPSTYIITMPGFAEHRLGEDLAQILSTKYALP